MAILFGTKNNDTLIGTNDMDLLDGFQGADKMAGGKNDDIYYVDNAKDVVTELENEGIDRIVSAVSYKLADHVENLTLGNTAVNGTGNALDNEISGSIANNTL